MKISKKENELKILSLFMTVVALKERLMNNVHDEKRKVVNIAALILKEHLME